MFANWTAVYTLLYISDHLATCVSVCLLVCLCTQCQYTIIGTTNSVHTSPRMRNRELFPHPLGPHTSTFIPDFTWKCGTTLKQQQTLTPPPRNYVALPFPLTLPLPTHSYLKVQFFDQDISIWCYKRNMLKPGEGEAPKGIQLSKEISNWETPFPLCDHVSTYLHKCLTACTHTPNKAICLHHLPCPGDKGHCWYKIWGGSNTDSIILADIINTL